MLIREIAQKQWEIRAKAMGNTGKSNHFCPKYMPPHSEFSHCFCPTFSIAFARISGKAMGNSGKSNEKFGQKQWENSESGGIYFGQKLLLLPEFPIAFARIFYCFSPPNFPLLLPEFPTAFARIFFFFFFLGGEGGTVPPASYAYG